MNNTVSNSSRHLLDAVYSRLGFEDGDLFAATDKPGDTSAQDWLSKGDWLILAKKVGAEKVFFVDNYPIIIFAEKKSNEPAEWVRAFNSVWGMARPQMLFLAREGELSVLNLTKQPARHGEVPGGLLCEVQDRKFPFTGKKQHLRSGHAPD